MVTSLRIQPRTYSNDNMILSLLHEEAIAIQSIDAFYIPRTLVFEDKIFGEDRLSKFKEAYPILGYLIDVDGYQGQGSFATKFGLQIDSNTTLIISTAAWDRTVGQFGSTILPNRPCEGDLIYLPMTKGLFSITYVNTKTPFYQLGQKYTYQLSIELFNYSSERLETGIPEIDAFEAEHTQDTTLRPNIDTLPRGADNQKFRDRGAELNWNSGNPFGDI
jgi:hypothetical protein